MTENPTKDKFMKLVKGHECIIELDQGVHRSILFKQPNTLNLHFRLNTWPDHLSFSGDCGSYVFSRTYDMFDFFSRDRPEHTKPSRISFDYWAEKVQSMDKYGNVHEFDDENYQKVVRNFLSEHASSMSHSDAEKLSYDVEMEGLLDNCDSEHDAYHRLSNFLCPVTDERIFQEFWEYDMKKLSWRFVFACRAIQWGIKKYDLLKQGRTQEEHDKKILKGLI